MLFDLAWKPDRSAAATLQTQIEGFIRNKIANGEWTAGTKIPSQRTLAASFGVNRSTIVAVIGELVAMGLLEGDRGGGTRVSNHTWNLLAPTPPPDWLSYVKSGIHRPNLPTIQYINEAEFIPNIIRHGTGELSPDLLPTEKVQSILQNLPRHSLSLGYGETKGDLTLREQISRHVRRRGIEVSPSSILVVSGALQALQLIAIGLLKRGSTVLLEKPSYLYSVPIFQSAGMTLVGTPMDDQGIQPTALVRLKRQHQGTLLYTIPTFHNPTGTLMTEARRSQLMAVCREEGLPILEDDVYSDLWLDSLPPAPLKAVDSHGIVLYLGSLSKTMSPGLRVGWVIGPEAVIQRLADIKMQTDYGSSSLSQALATELLSSGIYEEHVQFVREQLRIRRDTTISSLQKHMMDIADWNIPRGGFYIWLRLYSSISSRELFEKMLKEGILLNPGTIYDRQANSYLRISYAYATLNEIKNGIEKLTSLVR